MISLSTVLIVLWYRQLTLIVWYDIFIGIVDSSGIRITATPTIRQYDAGILEAGAVVNRLQLVPPHEKAFVSKSYCNKECLQRVGLCLTSWYVCRSINRVLLSSFMTYHQNIKSKTKDDTSAFSCFFCVIRAVIFLVFCVVFCRPLFFPSGHCM